MGRCFPPRTVRAQTVLRPRAQRNCRGRWAGEACPAIRAATGQNDRSRGKALVRRGGSPLSALAVDRFSVSQTEESARSVIQHLDRQSVTQCRRKDGTDRLLSSSMTLVTGV